MNNVSGRNRNLKLEKEISNIKPIHSITIKNYDKKYMKGKKCKTSRSITTYVNSDRLCLHCGRKLVLQTDFKRMQCTSSRVKWPREKTFIPVAADQQQ